MGRSEGSRNLGGRVGAVVGGVSPGAEELTVPGRARRGQSGSRRASAGSGRAAAASPSSRRQFCGRHWDGSERQRGKGVPVPKDCWASGFLGVLQAGKWAYTCSDDSLAPTVGHQHPLSTQSGSLGAPSSQCDQPRWGQSQVPALRQVMPCSAPNTKELQSVGIATATPYLQALP